MLFFIVPFCSIFIILGASLMAGAGSKILTGIQASHWPHTSARMVSIESKDTSNSEGNSREICVRYTYRVNGQDYEGTTIHPAYSSSSFEKAHQGLETALKPAREVRVYYNEANPGTSTLSVGFYSCSLALLSGGFLFFSTGVGFLLTFWFAIAGNENFAAGITVLQ